MIDAVNHFMLNHQDAAIAIAFAPAALGLLVAIILELFWPVP